MALLWPKSHCFGLVTSLSDMNPLSCLLLMHFSCEVSENDYYKLFSPKHLQCNESFKAPKVLQAGYVPWLPVPPLGNPVCVCVRNFTVVKVHPSLKPKPEEMEHNGKCISQYAFGQTVILTWAWSQPNSVLCEVMFITVSSETMQVTEWMQNDLHVHRNADNYCLHQTLHLVLQKNVTLQYITDSLFETAPEGGGGRQCIKVHACVCMPSRELVRSWILMSC